MREKCGVAGAAAVMSSHQETDKMLEALNQKQLNIEENVTNNFCIYLFRIINYCELGPGYHFPTK